MRLETSTWNPLFSAFVALTITSVFPETAKAQDEEPVAKESPDKTAPKNTSLSLMPKDTDYKTEKPASDPDTDKAKASNKVSHEQHPSSLPARIGLEMLGGVAGVGASALLGTGVWLAISGGDCGYDNLGCEISSHIVGLGIFGGVSVFTLPLGVYLVGNAIGGNGNYWATLLFHLVGGGIGWGAAVPLIAATRNWAFVAIPIVTHFAGAVLGYELSSAWAEDSKAPPQAHSSRETFLITPTVTPDLEAKGLSVGISGLFSL
jgi:hypothetical protein